MPNRRILNKVNASANQDTNWNELDKLSRNNISKATFQVCFDGVTGVNDINVQILGSNDHTEGGKQAVELLNVDLEGVSGNEVLVLDSIFTYIRVKTTATTVTGGEIWVNANVTEVS